MKKLTKRKYEMLVKEKIILENDLRLMLIRALGFTIDPCWYIIDDSTMNRITYHKKYMKYAPNRMLIPIHKSDILFDPFHDKKLMTYLFQRYLSQNNTYISAFCNVLDTNNQEKERIQIVTDKGIIYTNSYYNPIFGYADYIFNTEYGAIPFFLVEPMQKLARLDEVDHELEME